MEYLSRLQNVSVLGAAGKMGSGILLLTALEMADQMLKPENKGNSFVLNAIDLSPEGLSGLLKYLKNQVLKNAEKRVVLLRKTYAGRSDLIENSDIIDAYVSDVMSIVRLSGRIESAYDSTLVFEAVSENPELKTRIFGQINENNPNDPWFFTNTSSIPIKELDSRSGLNGRIIGFHFYNPPAVQKLVELITTAGNSTEIIAFAKTFAANLKKIVVPSNDIAGFIGNGHFMRDGLFGIQLAEELTKRMSFVEAIYTVNRATQDFLMRPMGIFQLIDYVGLDVMQFIMRVMDPQMKGETLHSTLLDELILKGIRGGQYSDGSQKDGFLKYEKGKIVGVIDAKTANYIALTEFSQQADEVAGKPPAQVRTWKNLVKAADKDIFLRSYFTQLAVEQTLAARLAFDYVLNSKAIGLKLVADGVATTAEDVNTVLLTGFFHAYGPINDYI
ncbi:MAG: 3-hydroxyacyl-CoA dehydrogenase family protein [Bacteroidales bacterium]